MVLGMSLSTFTLLHVLVSLAGIGSGFVVIYGLLTGNGFDRWTAFFLVTTVLTSATGFLFPFEKLLPSHVVGMISLVVLAVAIAARYGFHMTRAWRSVYVVSAVLALYFNVFVLVVQSFLKVGTLHALAPTGTETPFKIAQLVVLVVFVALGTLAVKKFHPDSLMAAARA